MAAENSKVFDPSGKAVNKILVFPVFWTLSPSQQAPTTQAQKMPDLHCDSWPRQLPAGRAVLLVGRAGSWGGQQNDEVAKQPRVICLFCLGKSPGESEAPAQKSSVWYMLGQGLGPLARSRAVTDPVFLILRWQQEQQPPLSLPAPSFGCSWYKTHKPRASPADCFGRLRKLSLWKLTSC